MRAGRLRAKQCCSCAGGALICVCQADLTPGLCPAAPWQGLRQCSPWLGASPAPSGGPRSFCSPGSLAVCGASPGS